MTRIREKQPGDIDIEPLEIDIDIDRLNALDEEIVRLKAVLAAHEAESARRWAILARLYD
jgi:uncharacterized small protein (DUF1192 family)